MHIQYTYIVLYKLLKMYNINELLLLLIRLIEKKQKKLKMDMSNFFQIRYAQSIFNQLGTTVANEYVPFDNCHRK